MSEYWYKAFLTPNQDYVLIDIEGDIRASAPDIKGIVLAKRHYGFGTIHKLNFEGRTIKIGEEIK